MFTFSRFANWFCSSIRRPLWALTLTVFLSFILAIACGIWPSDFSLLTRPIRYSSSLSPIPYEAVQDPLHDPTPTTSYYHVSATADIPHPLQSLRPSEKEKEELALLPPTPSPSPSPSPSPLPLPSPSPLPHLYPLEPEWEWARNISIVYMWVNGSDPYHLAQKGRYGHTTVDNRDRSMDELRYSLRSVRKNLPWHTGTIFIVTPDQTPNWLVRDNPHVKIISQSTILPKKANPTFNSFLIEQYLDMIPGVSDRFLHMNDDYFFRNFAHPSLFFTPTRGCKFFWETWSLRKPSPALAAEIAKIDSGGGVFKGWNDRFETTIDRTTKLLAKYFGVSSRKLLAVRHAPFVWNRDSFAEMRTTFWEYIEPMIEHKFRHEADYATPYLNQAVYIKKGLRHPSYQIAGEDAKRFQFGNIVNSEERNNRTFDKLRKSNVVHFNLNDDYSNLSAGLSMVRFLKEMYPEPAPWEIPEPPSQDHAVSLGDEEEEE